jgi:hypothetical protein
MTFVEAILALTFVRLVFRLVVKGWRFVTGGGKPAVTTQSLQARANKAEVL